MADELKTFLRQHLDTGKRTDELEALLGDLDYELAVLYHELLEYNADFDALRVTEDHGDAFTSDEIDELRSLFGLYGTERDKRLPPGPNPEDYVRQRQLAWRQNREISPHGSTRQRVAERAYTRYGLILPEFTGAIET